MKRIAEKFLRYTAFDTQSDEQSLSAPSTAKQLDLARALQKELEVIGCTAELDEKSGIVYAVLEGNDSLGEPIGLVAHMDTAAELSGKNVKGRIIENYDGGTIVLNEEYSMDPARFPALEAVVGDDIIVTDGTTLLGNDDKAGIAIIMQTLENLAMSQKPHVTVMAAFTPDEEVGRGTDNFDLKRFNPAYAYTIDGERIDHVDYETFNAASVTVHFAGKSIHPGSAKNQMTNAAQMAVRFAAMIPEWLGAEHREKREGFIHLLEMSGECESAQLHYIVRDHDYNLLVEKIELLKKTADFFNTLHKDMVTLEIKEQYRNMKDYMNGDFRSVEHAQKALRRFGIEPVSVPVRGGTDGAMLTMKGLNTPNLGTGGGNCHGRYEFASITKMDLMTKILETILCTPADQL
jgi:tripeptide aminopeptidase